VGYAPDDIGYLGMAKRVEIPPQRRLQACESNPQKVEGQIHIPACIQSRGQYCTGAP
jgi:hypothetical protein